MARLVGVDLPRDKRIEVGLTYIYGIGLTTSKKILAETGVNPDVRVKDLSEEDLGKLRDYIQENLTVEGDLHREVSQNVKRLMEIGCYRGLRHRKGLPVRGQRTHTNARTRKGARQIVTHGHIMVNGRRVDVPSYRVKAGDVVSVAPKSKELLVIKSALVSNARFEVPAWLEVDIEKLQGNVLALPQRDQIDLDINEQLIVELYSK